MDLSEADIRVIGKRLDFSADTLRAASAASSIYQEMKSFSEMRPSECAERLDKMPDEAVSAAAMSTPYGKPRVMLESYLSRWKDMKPTISGEDLKARGIPPGPKYKQVLSRLRAAWVDGEVKSAEEEAALLNELLK
jgi:tRNA nucleotidyltransferase (CCA-adding enzyme)